MESFKIALECMANTGAGLEGLEYERFQDYIVHKVCRYYFELLPILQDRPNVTPWYTNFDDDLSTESVTIEATTVDKVPSFRRSTSCTQEAVCVNRNQVLSLFVSTVMRFKYALE
jgi:hypothetical protein